MKKRIALLFLLLLCITSLPGCGMFSSKEDTETEELQTDKKEKKEKKEKKDKKSDTSDKETSEHDAEKKLKELFSKDDFNPLPVITFEKSNNQWYKDNSSQLLCETAYETISIEDSGYQELSDALFTYSNDKASEMLAMAQECVDSCYTDTYLMDMMDEYTYYTFSNSYEHTRFDHQVLSIMEYYDDYTMGVHGSYYYGGTTFDVETGNILSLPDLIEGDFDAFSDFAKDYMIAELLQREEYGFSPVELEATINDYQLQNDIPWYLNGSGMVFVFNIYSIGPYAMGAMDVCIPYTELSGYMKQEYLPAEGIYIGKLFPNVTSCFRGFVQDSSSQDMKVTDAASYNEIYIDTDIINSYGDNEGFSVRTANSDIIVTDYGYFESAYIVRKSDKIDYLLLCCDDMSSDYSIIVYQIKDGTLTEVSSLPGVRVCNGSVFEQQIIGSIRVDYLGTYFAATEFAWNEDHSFTQKEDALYFEINPWNAITTIAPLPVTIDGQHSYLPVGTTLQIIGCDGHDTVFFRIQGEDTTGEIKQDRSGGYPYLIEGLSEYEYFEFLPYAG